MQQRTFASLVIAGAVALTACGEDAVSPEIEAPAALSFSQVVAGTPNLALLGTSIDEINEVLAERGAGFAVARAEYVLAASAGGRFAENANHTVFASDRQLRLATRWVPGDARRLADGNNITYLNYRPFMPANFGTATQLDGEVAVDASFMTWNEVQCSGLDLVKRADTGVFPSAVFAGGNPFVADIVTLGFMPGIFFDIVLGAGASRNVLGVTFTSIWGTRSPDGSFTPSDIDNDGRNDTALKEVWYNDAFEWTDNAAAGGNVIDIETVALHENGHALELGHFGTVHATFNSGKGNDNLGRLHVSPRAVMNAVVLGTLREPLGSDNASYCGNFESWPQ